MSLFMSMYAYLSASSSFLIILSAMFLHKLVQVLYFELWILPNLPKSLKMLRQPRQKFWTKTLTP